MSRTLVTPSEVAAALQNGSLRDLEDELDWRENNRDWVLDILTVASGILNHLQCHVLATGVFNVAAAVNKGETPIASEGGPRSREPVDRDRAKFEGIMARESERRTKEAVCTRNPIGRESFEAAVDAVSLDALCAKYPQVAAMEMALAEAELCLAEQQNVGNDPDSLYAKPLQSIRKALAGRAAKVEVRS